MTVDNLERVARLCREVIELTEQVRAEMQQDGERVRSAYPDIADDFLPSTALGSLTTGALRRRSMDLTRALADLRR